MTPIIAITLIIPGNPCFASITGSFNRMIIFCHSKFNERCSLSFHRSHAFVFQDWQCAHSHTHTLCLVCIQDHEPPKFVNYFTTPKERKKKKVSQRGGLSMCHGLSETSTGHLSPHRDNKGRHPILSLCCRKTTITSAVQETLETGIKGKWVGNEAYLSIFIS